jgi:hypothetical protein
LEILVEEAAVLANTELRAAIVEHRRVEARIRSMLELFERGRDAGQAGYGQAAEKAGRIIRQAREQVPPAPPSKWAEELAAGLATNASYGLDR